MCLPFCCVLQMPRSASTFCLNESAKNSTVVQRSNSLDHPPVKTRIPVCIRTPCTPPKRPSSSTVSESTKGPDLKYSTYIQEYKYTSNPAPMMPPISTPPSPQKPTLTQPVHSFIQPKNIHLKSFQDLSRPLTSGKFQPRAPAPQSVSIKNRILSESCRDPQEERHNAVLTSRRETLI
ncbi:uncharacterized protein V3H82_009000 [Fundulus diaphanus]